MAKVLREVVIQDNRTLQKYINEQIDDGKMSKDDIDDIFTEKKGGIWQLFLWWDVALHGEPPAPPLPTNPS